MTSDNQTITDCNEMNAFKKAFADYRFSGGIIEADAEHFWKAARAESAKALAEKDAEIDQLNALLKLERECNAGMLKELHRLVDIESKYIHANEEIERLKRVIGAALAVVNEQAKDDGLWFRAKYITEAYLQKELRRLHAAAEKEDV